MTNIEQDRWTRVKGRLRTSVGEDVYTSWFARMDLEAVQDESVHLSVPTRFLKSWIQAHYADRVLTCWQAEMPEVHRIDLTVRTAMRCAPPVKEAPAPSDQRRIEQLFETNEQARHTISVCAAWLGFDSFVMAKPINDTKIGTAGFGDPWLAGVITLPDVEIADRSELDG